MKSFHDIRYYPSSIFAKDCFLGVQTNSTNKLCIDPIWKPFPKDLVKINVDTFKRTLTGSAFVLYVIKNHAKILIGQNKTS